MNKLTVIALIALAAVTGCSHGPSKEQLKNRDPRSGDVYLYTNTLDYKVCDGTALLIHTFARDDGREAIAVVPNSTECVSK